MTIIKKINTIFKINGVEPIDFFDSSHPCIPIDPCVVFNKAQYPPIESNPLNEVSQTLMALT